jgi:hypothetical protein
MLYAGVDVSKDKVSVAVLTSGGTKLTSGDFDITTEGLKLLELTLKHLKDEIRIPRVRNYLNSQDLLKKLYPIV